MKTKLGSLKTIDLRSIWGHEALHFTKWLSNDENISVLAEELGIDIENIKVEESAGRYSVDIIADEVNTQRKVIIENQLESTDHKHLGQVLTYAAAFDASIIIWIVKDYTDEHKQAIDWFNRNMPEQISFFLVQLELWQIGDSDPAPKFNIICQPNNWAKNIQNAVLQERGGTSDLKLLQQRFWQYVKDFALKSYNNLNVSFNRTPRPQHWHTIKVGTSKAHLALTFNSRANQIGCELYITKDEHLYRNIAKDEVELKKVLGDDLIFMDLPESTAFRIVKYYSCDPKDESKWDEYSKWLIENAENFHKAFKKYF